MVADAVLRGGLFVAGLAAVLGVYGLWLWGRSQRTRVSLAETARAAWADVAPPSARLVVDVDDDLAVSADPDKLQTLFAALFENSVEHGSASGRSSRGDEDEAGGRDVTVRVEGRRDGFAVADDGPGIPEGDRERVFEAGYSTRADRPGLGLVLVRTLCNAYGWDVAVADGDDGARIVVSDVQFYSTWEGETDAAGEATGGTST